MRRRPADHDEVGQPGPLNGPTHRCRHGPRADHDSSFAAQGTKSLLGQTDAEVGHRPPDVIDRRLGSSAPAGADRRRDEGAQARAGGTGYLGPLQRHSNLADDLRLAERDRLEAGRHRKQVSDGAPLVAHRNQSADRATKRASDPLEDLDKLRSTPPGIGSIGVDLDPIAGGKEKGFGLRSGAQIAQAGEHLVGARGEMSQDIDRHDTVAERCADDCHVDTLHRGLRCSVDGRGAGEELTSSRVAESDREIRPDGRIHGLFARSGTGVSPGPQNSFYPITRGATAEPIRQTGNQHISTQEGRMS